MTLTLLDYIAIVATVWISMASFVAVFVFYDNRKSKKQDSHSKPEQDDLDELELEFKEKLDELLKEQQEASKDEVNASTTAPTPAESPQVPFKILITSVNENIDSEVDADTIQFEVVEGDPDESDVKAFFESGSMSILMFEYDQDTKSGSFCNLDFEYKEAQVLYSKPARFKLSFASSVGTDEFSVRTYLCPLIDWATDASNSESMVDSMKKHYTAGTTNNIHNDNCELLDDGTYKYEGSEAREPLLEIVDHNDNSSLWFYRNYWVCHSINGQPSFYGRFD